MNQCVIQSKEKSSNREIERRIMNLYKDEITFLRDLKGISAFTSWSKRPSLHSIEDTLTLIRFCPEANILVKALINREFIEKSRVTG